jgi:hypothetical protein
MNYQDRIAIVRAKGDLETDCYGTALYIAGKTDKDEMFGFIEVKRYLKKLKTLIKPKVPCIVAYVGPTPPELQFVRTSNNFVHHLGIVTSVDPLLIAQRNGKKFQENQQIPFEEIAKRGYRVLYKAFE